MKEVNMTDRKQALIDLRDKVKAGETPDTHEITSALRGVYSGDAPVVFFLKCACDPSDIRATGAAKALHEAVLPVKMKLAGLHQFDGQWGVRIIPGGFMANNDTPARAWLLAILEALIAQEEKDKS